MSYDPKPGTAAFRLLAALEARPHGEEVMSSRLAELAGVDPICVVGSLTAARTAGVVFARKKGATERSPVFWSLVDHAKGYTEGRDSQQVLKAEPATADATDREDPANASPVGGPMGAGQPAAAGPAGDLRIALWSDGTLQIQRAAGDLTLSRDETRQLVAYLDSIALDAVREGAA